MEISSKFILIDKSLLLLQIQSRRMHEKLGSLDLIIKNMIKNVPIKDGNSKDDLIQLEVGKIITNSFIGAA